MFVKKLNAQDAAAYKTLRLEALSLHAGMYGNSYEAESAWTARDWENLLSNERQAFFGLYDGRLLIGSSGVFSDWNDSSGKTAILVGSYIRKEYRGKKLSHLLYQARIQWIIDSGFFNRILVGHKDGNEASRRANQAFGFDYIGQEEKNWGDGSRGILHHYEVRLK